MIKNIIFDMGGVLIDYNPEKALYSVFSKEYADILLKEIFRNPVWSDKDRGIIFPADIMRMKKDVIPAEIYDKVCGMVDNFYPYMPPFEKMYDFVKSLKENGYGIYLLSNVGKEFHRVKKDIPVLELFDGFVASSDYKVVKPEPEIYNVLFEKFSLIPEECIFIDDVQKNIDGAVKAGMHGHCYSHGNLSILKEDMREKGVKI